MAKAATPRGELSRGLIRERIDIGLHTRGKERENRRINTIGGGELPSRAGEVAQLPLIGDLSVARRSL